MRFFLFAHFLYGVQISTGIFMPPILFAVIKQTTIGKKKTYLHSTVVFGLSNEIIFRNMYVIDVNERSLQMDL